MNNIAGLIGESSVPARYSYDAFGTVTATAGAIPTTHQSFPGYRGQLHDSATGKVYLRNRFYSPSLGRFLRPDPARDGNLYNYAGSDPVNR